MTRDLGPPWVIFSDQGHDVAILPAGRPGEVANVEGVPKDVVSAVVAAVNGGRMSVEQALTTLGQHRPYRFPAAGKLIAPDGTARDVAAGDQITARFEDDGRVELDVRPTWPPCCDSCHEQLTEPGAVVLAPPTADGFCRKLHLCVFCFQHLLGGLAP